MSLSYDDIMSYCGTNKLANKLCKDSLFWLVKLDHELQFVGTDGILIKPSDYIRKYGHPDINGLDIYKRWNTYNIGTNEVGFNIRLCVERKYNDIAIWILGKISTDIEDHYIFIANISSEVGNTEMLQLLDDGKIFRYMLQSVRNYKYKEYMKYLSSIKIKYNVDVIRANHVTKYGRLDILKDLEHKNILPDVTGANAAAGFGYINILQWLEERNIFPNDLAIHSVIQHGYLDTIKWLHQEGYYIDKYAGCLAAQYGYLNILHWLVGNRNSTRSNFTIFSRSQ